MSAETWLIISSISFSISAVMLIVIIVLFIRLKIPSVISDLTGFAASKQIKRMKQSNETNSKNVTLPFSFMRKDKKKTKELRNQGTTNSFFSISDSTEKLIMVEEHDRIERGMIVDNSTTILSNLHMDPTTVLDGNHPVLDSSSRDNLENIEFTVDTDIVVTNTKDIID